MPDPSLYLQFLASGIGAGCVYGLIGIGYCVIYNASGIVNFAQGMFVMLGGMVTSVLLTEVSLPLPLAAALAIVAVALLGLVMERLIIRPLWSRGATTFVMILATLVVQIVVQRLTLMAAGDAPRALPEISSAGPLKLGGVALSLQMIWILLGSVCLVAALTVFFRFSETGRAMRACAHNQEAAALLGVPVGRMLAYAFMLSAALGAIAGVLVTPTQYTAYDVGVPFAISGFIAAIIGGFGNPLGAFFGGIMLGVVQSLAIVTVGSGYRNVAALAIMLLFLFLRPAGLLGVAKT